MELTRAHFAALVLLFGLVASLFFVYLLSQDNDALSQQLSQEQREKAVLSSQVGNLTAEAASLKTRVSGLSSDVTSLNSTLRNLAVRARIYIEAEGKNCDKDTSSCLDEMTQSLKSQEKLSCPPVPLKFFGFDGYCCKSACPVQNLTATGAEVYHFNGIDDYIVVPNSDIINPTNAITVSAWFKTTDTAGGVVVKRSGDTGYRIVLANGGIVHWLVGNGLTLEQRDTGYTAYNDNKWHQVVGTWSEQDNITRIYLDGRIDSSSYGSSGPFTGPIFNTDTDLTISKSDDQGFLSGDIGEVSILDRALSASEVQQRYSSNLYKYAND